MAEARIVKFCVQVDCVKSYLYGYKPPIKGHGQSHVTRFFKFYPNHIFVIVEARHFKFRVLIDIEEYECMHDILLPKDVFSFT